MSAAEAAASPGFAFWSFESAFSVSPKAPWLTRFNLADEFMQLRRTRSAFIQRPAQCGCLALQTCVILILSALCTAPGPCHTIPRQWLEDCQTSVPAVKRRAHDTMRHPATSAVCAAMAGRQAQQQLGRGFLFGPKFQSRSVGK